jgi:hypothetical protein
VKKGPTELAPPTANWSDKLISVTFQSLAKLQGKRTLTDLCDLQLPEVTVLDLSYNNLMDNDMPHLPSVVERLNAQL